MRTLTRDAFLDVVLEDEDLLRAEFDAIVADAVLPGPPGPPAPPPPAAPPAPRDRPAPRPGSPGWPVPSARRSRLPDPERPRRGRQRAPPTRK
jgi:hypothetical protein